MAKALKAALKRSSKEDSSFWDRMKKIVDESRGFGSLSVEQKASVLNFFTPEWEARDGRFFPRLDDFTDAVPSVEGQDDLLRSLTDVVEYLDEVEDERSRIGVNQIANVIDASFNEAMALTLTLTHLGIAKRVAPFCRPTGTPVYNVDIDYNKLKLTSNIIDAYGPEGIPFFIKFFQPELDGGNVDFACDTLSRSSAYSPAVGAEDVLLSNPNVAFSVADIERDVRAGNRERAAITRRLLNLAFEHSHTSPTSGVIDRVEPFYRVHPNGSKTPRLLFAFSPVVKAQVTPGVIEIGTLSKQEAKNLLSSLTPVPSSAPLVLNEELKTFIQKAVQEAVEKALVDPDRQQMEGIRAMLRERKLPTADPVSTIKAKLSKKKLPSSKA
jgi:hypothetical protein